ncbi:MAG: Holliday junction resolvase RuvX [Clostridia bacterium]|nr:Holliday junction resolvase RuvX [Clostridia bacterium]
MKILGLDYGEVRTGVAISDELGMIAHGMETIEHGNSDKKLIERIKEIVLANQVSKIVIGYPLNMNATKGPRIEKTDLFVKKLERELKLEVIKIDERLTTVAAHKTMTQLNLSNKKKKKIVDTISAEYILQMYLDKLSKN